MINKYEYDELAKNKHDAKKIEKSIAFEAAKRRRAVQYRNAASSIYGRQPWALEPVSRKDTIKDRYLTVPKKQMPGIQQARVPRPC